MKGLILIFISISLYWSCHGQVQGKIFVSKTLEYLHLINDTTLCTSFGDESDTTTYYIKSDTLFIKNEYWRSSGNSKSDHIIKWQNYKIIKQSNDSLYLLNKFNGYKKPSNWEDTLLLVNIEKLKESVAEFKFLKLEFSSPWSGAKQITVDSLGKVNFVDRPILLNPDNPAADKNAKNQDIIGKLTQKEFTNFKNLLSKFLPSRLQMRRGCPLDGATSNFEILIGEKRIISTGCELSWTQTFLVNYLNELDQNTGLIVKPK